MHSLVKRAADFLRYLASGETLEVVGDGGSSTDAERRPFIGWLFSNDGLEDSTRGREVKTGTDAEQARSRGESG